MKLGSGGSFWFSRDYSKELFGLMVSSWCDSTLRVYVDVCRFAIDKVSLTKC